MQKNFLNYSMSLQTLWQIDTITETIRENEVRKGQMIFQRHERQQWQDHNFWTIPICAIVNQRLIFLSEKKVLLFSPSYQGISPAVKSSLLYISINQGKSGISAEHPQSF